MSKGPFRRRERDEETREEVGGTLHSNDGGRVVQSIVTVRVRVNRGVLPRADVKSILEGSVV